MTYTAILYISFDLCNVFGAFDDSHEVLAHN